MKRELVLALGVLCAAAMTGCSGSGSAAASAAGTPSPQPPPVVVVRAVQQDVPIYGEWIGTTEGDVNADIRPKVEGYLLTRLYTEGTLVKRGDPLFEIDPRQFQSQLEQARASLAQAQASLSKAQRDVARFKPLVAEHAVSQEELDNAASAEQSAQASVRAAKAAVEQADLNLSWTKVEAPITGIAGLAQTQVGNLVNPATVLTTVSTCDPIRVMYQLSEQEYMRLQAKAAAASGAQAAEGDGALELVLTDGTVFPQKGHVLVAGRQVDVKTGTITAVGLFPNPGNLLRPGQYAKVRAVTDLKRGAVLVPQRAVNEMQGTFQVAVIGGDGKAEIRPVQAADRVGNMWLIEKGIEPGALVVVEGFSRVKSGTVVNAKEETLGALAGGGEALAGGGPGGTPAAAVVQAGGR